ncbi:hypothetical protein ACFLQN_04680, partial [Candidatus Aenigmatarchaeota archaeon]
MYKGVIVALLLVILIGNVVYADILIEESPIIFDFDQGTHYNTRVVENHLELEYSGSYASSGYWTSPIFYVNSEAALWNYMQGDANWDEFGLELLTENYDFEDPDDSMWHWWSLSPSQDCSVSHQGCSFRLDIDTEPPYQDAVFMSHIAGNQPESAQHNIFRTEYDDVIHWAFWARTDMKYGRITPKLRFLNKQGTLFTGVDKRGVIDEYELSPQSGSSFRQYAGEFRMDEILPDAVNEYYGSVVLEIRNIVDFARIETPPIQSKLWVDDFHVFKDSRIKIQARNSKNYECTDWSDWSDARLLYNIMIAAPASVSKCIQFKINLYRIGADNSPKLNSLELSFSEAFDFTRPWEDILPAVFDWNGTPVYEKDPVSIGADGELFNDASGKPVKFYSLNIEPYFWAFWHNENERYTDETFANYLCNYAEKYGFNMIKFRIGGGEPPTGPDGQLDRYEDFFNTCKEKGIYFFIMPSPMPYVDHLLGHDFYAPDGAYWSGGGYGGPAMFTCDEAIDGFKEYFDIVLNHDFETPSGTTTIREDPAFVLTELMNEVTLYEGWYFNKLDGILNDPDTDNSVIQEVAPYFANKLRLNFNEWLLDKYTDYADLEISWGQSAFFGEEDGCVTGYGDFDRCNISIINYSYSWHWPDHYRKRIIDTSDYILYKEEYFYNELTGYIESNSNFLVSGGKPHWGPEAGLYASDEVLTISDSHPYGTTGDRDQENYLYFYMPTDDLISDYYRYLSPKHRPFANQPNTASETTYIGFSPHAAEYMLIPLLLGSQGKDLISLHSLSLTKGESSPEFRPRITDFTLQFDIPAVALQPTASRLYRRDLEKLPSKQIYLTRQSTINHYLQRAAPDFIGFADPGNLLKYTIEWGSMQHTEDYIDPELEQAINHPYIFENNDFTYNIEDRQVLITTDGTECAIGNYDGSSEDVGFLEFTINQEQGEQTYTICVSSLDDLSLEESEDILLTLVAHADNSKHMWDTYHRRAWCHECNHPTYNYWGIDPTWLAAVDTDITLNIDANVTIYPLTSNGQRNYIQTMYIQPDNGKVSFTAGSHNTPWYEIIIRVESGKPIEIEGNVTDCIDDDDICPENCTFINDNDCPVECIDDDDVCPDGCNATNDNDCLLECIDDDDVCPEGCNATNDNDCLLECIDDDD